MKLSELTARLTAAGISDPAGEARILFRDLCGFSDWQLYGFDPEGPDGLLLRAAERRCAHEPLQYILGTVGFWRETYLVTPDCLIPRPDTELLVEQAVRLLPPGAHFADFCTGSGCIAISTLCTRKDTHADAFDISAGALAVADENARRCGVSDRISFCRADLLSGLPDQIWDAVLCNPPYIPASDIPSLSPEVRCEPHPALDGGEDGLLFYRTLIPAASRCLAPGGFLLFEIGWNQAAALRAMADEAGWSAQVFRDAGGRDRAVLLQP